MRHFGSLVKFPSVKFILELFRIKSSLDIFLQLLLYRLRIMHDAHSGTLKCLLLFLSRCPSHKFLFLYFDSLLLSFLNVFELLF